MPRRKRVAKDVRIYRNAKIGGLTFKVVRIEGFPDKTVSRRYDLENVVVTLSTRNKTSDRKLFETFDPEFLPLLANGQRGSDLSLENADFTVDEPHIFHYRGHVVNPVVKAGRSKIFRFFYNEAGYFNMILRSQSLQNQRSRTPEPPKNGVILTMGRIFGREDPIQAKADPTRKRKTGIAANPHWGSIPKALDDCVAWMDMVRRKKLRTKGMSEDEPPLRPLSEIEALIEEGKIDIPDANEFWQDMLVPSLEDDSGPDAGSDADADDEGDGDGENEMGEGFEESLEEGEDGPGDFQIDHDNLRMEPLFKDDPGDGQGGDQSPVATTIAGVPFVRRKTEAAKNHAHKQSSQQKPSSSHPSASEEAGNDGLANSQEEEAIELERRREFDDFEDCPEVFLGKNEEFTLLPDDPVRIDSNARAGRAQGEMLKDDITIRLFDRIARIRVLTGMAKKEIFFQDDVVYLSTTTKFMDPAEVDLAVTNQMARPLIEELVRLEAPYVEWKAGKRAKKYIFRKNKTRWGSCNIRTGVISINVLLWKYSLGSFHTVLAHEISHLFHGDHGREFYAKLTEIFPDWKLYTKDIDKHITNSDLNSANSEELADVARAVAHHYLRSGYRQGLSPKLQKLMRFYFEPKLKNAPGFTYPGMPPLNKKEHPTYVAKGDEERTLALLDSLPNDVLKANGLDMEKVRRRSQIYVDVYDSDKNVDEVAREMALDDMVMLGFREKFLYPREGGGASC